jgi:hypothetical protein
VAWHGLPGPLGSTQHFGFHPRQLTLSHQRVAWSSRKRLIWRQHRGQALWTVITVTALCALMASFGLSAGHWLAGYHTWLRQLAAAGCPPPDAHSAAFHVR